ncbi:GntP family permease [Parapedobacter sp. 2B3]|uniref:GntP family permease n=1 Tax=Parapedobacter sp. 2B3 TaxID=3342381 RepID=UPI0035B67171
MIEVSLIHSLLALLASVGVIVLLTTRLKVHAFFALLLACLVVGLGVGMPLGEVISISKAGFGNIIGSLALIIVFGTTLGIILEHTGATVVLASNILRLTGRHRAAHAMNLTGYVVGLPIFCDSGYIVLSGLNRGLARQTGTAMALMATSLAAGLYAVHCLVPPHPGAAAATGTLGADFGHVILYGMLVAIPTAFCGLLWARFVVSRLPAAEQQAEERAAHPLPGRLPSLLLSVLPVAVPILLISIRSFSPPNGTFLPLRIVYALGIPEAALGIGILLALISKRDWKKADFNALLRGAIEKAGDILLIIGAGGAFGALIAQTNIAQYLAGNGTVGSMGIFFPFLVAAVLKTAQGSSSVAIITAATMVLPVLPSLGLDNEMGRVFAVLAMGAGSMMVSHANDSYFWVISRFSGVGMGTMLRVYTAATFIMGCVAIGAVYLLSLFF